MAKNIGKQKKSPAAQKSSFGRLHWSPHVLFKHIDTYNKEKTTNTSPLSYGTWHAR